MDRFLLITLYLFASVLFINAMEKPEALKVDKQSPKIIRKMNSDFDSMDWQVGIQSYTFNQFSLFDAIDAASDLGLKYVEATTWQKIERGKDESFNPWWMSAEMKQKVKDRCAEKGVEIVSFYCRPSKDDIEKKSEQVEKIFQFCKEMNLILTTDPIRVESGFGSMDFYDEMCQKYGVTMVLTNHPKSHGSPYWNPDDVLADCEGRSKYIGASVDVGHFMRDGTDPYNAVRKYTDAGRMYHFHFRDVDALGMDGRDVALGEGDARIQNMLEYMYAGGAAPILVFEYERDMDQPLKYIVPSVEYLKTISAELLKKGKKKVAREVAQNNPQGQFVKLWARDAAIDGQLRIEDWDSEKATIHGLHNTSDKITWNTKIKKGNYLVAMRYSEPYSGAAFSITIGDQQLSVLAATTQNWADYQVFDLGVVTISKDGIFPVVINGVQLALKEKNHEEALPDIHWLTLTPTKDEATFGSIDILSKFRGKKIFDGKTFKGWHGNNGESSMEWFRVEDGAIVGGTMEKPIPRNEFICTDREYDDFELRLKFKTKYPEGTNSWNGGVQFRSQGHPTIKHEMIGYQADILSWKWGALYDEQRRWTFLGTPLNMAEAMKQVKTDDWNSYVIRAEGPRIRLWLNGVLTLDYMEYDPTIPQTGYIGFQIHEDKNPCELWYKDIEIEELNKTQR